MLEELSEREKFIYLAGYIDGDGSIGIGQYPSAGRKAYKLVLDISSTNEDIIERLVKNYSGQVTAGSNPPETCKPLKQWGLYNRAAYKLIREVHPYLLLKKRQADLAIGFYQDCIRKKQKGKLRPKWLLSREEGYHVQMRALNAHGRDACTLPNPSLKQQPDDRELSDREKSIYFAAITDSEGTITIYHASQPSKNYYGYLLMLTIGNTDTRLIDWLENYFHGYRQVRAYKNKNWKDIELWTVWGVRAYRLLKQVRPFLIVKPKQADLAIEFYRKCITNTGKRPQWRKDKAYDYYLQMKNLNKRGAVSVSDNEEDSISSDSASQYTQLPLSSFV